MEERVYKVLLALIFFPYVSFACHIQEQPQGCSIKPASALPAHLLFIYLFIFIFLQEESG